MQHFKCYVPNVKYYVTFLCVYVESMGIIKNEWQKYNYLGYSSVVYIFNIKTHI